MPPYAEWQSPQTSKESTPPYSVDFSATRFMYLTSIPVGCMIDQEISGFSAEFAATANNTLANNNIFFTMILLLAIKYP
jgi:hypothetical protein